MRRCTRSKGFTFVEIVIAITIMSVGLGIGLVGTLRSTEALRTSDARSTEETRVRRALRRIVDELSTTGDEASFPDPGTAGSPLINYRRATGFDAGDVTWGDWRRLSLEPETGEVLDGLDNNGNGLVDEGMIVMLQGVGGGNQKRIVLCRGVSRFLEGEIENGNDDNGNGMDDEQGFVLQRSLEGDGSLLNIFITLEGVDQNGMRFQRTMSTSTRMRNWN